MQFSYEAHTAKLELRIMELEDTVKALALVAKTTADLISNLNEIMNHYADALGGVMLALPSRLPLWPVGSHPAPSQGNPGCSGYCTGPDNTPTDCP